jgi:glycosyltransferase involved in cell wall biosynthesis
MNSFILPLLANLLKIPFIFEIPNDPYLAYKQRSKFRMFLEREIDKYCMLLADKIVVLSEWSKQRLNQIGGISLSKIIALPSGADIELFTPLSKEECCTRLGLDSSPLYVGFVGNFFVHQGIDTLIDSSSHILRKFTNTCFLLVGDGPMMSTWQDKVSQKGLQEAFIFSGSVPYKQVPEYIGAMDICVAPHKRDTNQSSPVKLFDYMACGKPVVASNIDVVREIIDQNECAILVPPDSCTELAQAIISLLVDQTRREKMGMEARHFVTSRYDRRQTARTVQTIAQHLSSNY